MDAAFFMHTCKVPVNQEVLLACYMYVMVF